MKESPESRKDYRVEPTHTTDNKLFVFSESVFGALEQVKQEEVSGKGANPSNSSALNNREPRKIDHELTTSGLAAFFG